MRPVPVGNATHRIAIYLSQVKGDLSPRRFACAAAAALVVATQVLFQPGLATLWTPPDIAIAVGRYAMELVWIAAAMVVAFTLVDRSPVRGVARATAFALAHEAAAFGAVLLLGLAEAFPAWMVPLDVVFAESLRWSLLASFVTAVFVLHRHGCDTEQEAVACEETREALQREHLGMQLQLLQAQIEPHFLFNVFANMRRLYRTETGAGARMFDSLLHYLQAALPQIRQTSGTVADELALVRAYLTLMQVRMGARLQYTVDSDAALLRTSFPPMVLITLVENAVKHGLEQAPLGGRVAVAARLVGDAVEVTVADDGVGLGNGQSEGSGVGLVNIRRQLVLRYGRAASLHIEQRAEGGVLCTLRCPLGDDLADLVPSGAPAQAP